MKVQLIKDARIHHKAGEIVEVSPAEAGFLISTASAELMKAPERETEAPEREIEAPERETPEEKTKPVRETRKK